ncbi:hypothetical protein [Nevskia ramosa]|uniref:hypothetical protein n=1 Tax=Nevskia ramosa TaxID=64002 RepID=UPI0003B56ECC|nr:hypothetical protein [Nevskia ramosa]
MNLKSVLAAVVLLTAAVPAMAANVGVSINIGQPDFYGRLDVNDYPRPRVIYAQPVIIERHRVVEQPVYVRVPPNYRKDWRRYCGRYDACGRSVYFVDSRWYNDVYVPRYREREGRRGGDHDRGHDHDHGHDDHGRGLGNGHGRDRHDH